MENERRTEYNVDMRPEEDFLSDILSASQIRATTDYLDRQLDHCYARQLQRINRQGEIKKNI